MHARFYGCLVFASFGVFVPCAFDATHVAAAATLSADAAPAASSTNCAFDAPDPRDLPAAYAYDLESPDILRFIRGLAAVPERDQRRVFEAAVASSSEQPEKDVQATIDSRCPSPDAAYGALRATYVIVNDWKLRQLKDATRFQAFDAVVATAVSALSLGDELTPDQRLTATRPFAGFDSPAAAHPLPSSAGACIDTRARPIKLARPNYPQTAVFANTTGKIDIKIRLSDTADVRSATVFSDTIGNAIGGDEIRREAIFAAATTTYAPEMRACVSRAGAYIFQADFNAR